MNPTFLQYIKYKGGVIMKGNKKILVAALLVLLLAVSFTTYAIYRSSTTGTGSLKAAGWSVKIKDTDIENASFTFGYSDITWTTHRGKNNTIAPGDSGTITIPVDATGSEVDVVISAALGNATLPEGMSVSVSGDSSKTIPYAASNMKENIELTITWTGTESDTTTKDSSDMEKDGTTLSIPVTLTAKQALS